MEIPSEIVSAAIGVVGTLFGYQVKARVDRRSREDGSLFDERLAEMRKHEDAIADVEEHLALAYDCEEEELESLARQVIAFGDALKAFERLLNQRLAVFDEATADSLEELLAAYSEIAATAVWDEVYGRDYCAKFGGDADADSERIAKLRGQVEDNFRRLRRNGPGVIARLRFWRG